MKTETLQKKQGGTRESERERESRKSEEKQRLRQVCQLRAATKAHAEGNVNFGQRGIGVNNGEAKSVDKRDTTAEGTKSTTEATAEATYIATTTITTGNATEMPITETGTTIQTTTSETKTVMYATRHGTETVMYATEIIEITSTATSEYETNKTTSEDVTKTVTPETRGDEPYYEE